MTGRRDGDDVSALRLLLPGDAVVGDLTDHRADALDALADLYAYPTPVPATGWVRANMVSSVDGSAVGGNGLSGSLSGPADKAVFGVLRGLADLVLVGAGTVRAEGYRAPQAQASFALRRTQAVQQPAPALAIVTRSGNIPSSPALFAPGARIFVVTCAAADVDALRSRVGADRVLVAGEDDVDPDVAVAQLAARGLRRILVEGGPHLLGRVAAAGRLDELCLTWSPLVVAGTGPRIASGNDASLRLRLAHLIEADGALLGRWLVRRSS